MKLRNYDYVFLGSGCASLSIIMRMIRSNAFTQKKILLVDREPKNQNDRTWCFWEEEPGFFEEIVFKRWENLIFKESENEIINLNTGNYRYKMIRGIDFYEKCFSAIKNQQNIELIFGEISFKKIPENKHLQIFLNGEELRWENKLVIFNSIFIPQKTKKNFFHLLQHFKGWIIESEKKIFDPDRAVIMDFSVSQEKGTTFAYVLPFTKQRALIEYTLFSETLLPDKDYELALTAYTKKLTGDADFSIVERESGIIPMTNRHFPFFENNIYNIGTAGGQTKPSTGYTFQFIQRQADEIVNHLILGNLDSVKSASSSRFQFYDSTLLHLLAKQKPEGRVIFSTLFERNPANQIFKFLDNQTSFMEDLRLINTLPTLPFLKAGIIELIKMIYSPKKG